MKIWFTLASMLLPCALLMAQQPGSSQPSANDATQAQSTPAEKTATPDSTGVEPIKGEKPYYPEAAERAGIQGQVIVKVLVNEQGEVDRAEVVSGPAELAPAAVDAAKKWKFKPFYKGGRPVKIWTQLPFDFYFKGKVIRGGISADSSSTSQPSGPASSTINIPLRISPGASEGFLIHQVAPVYPPEAKRHGIEGTVVMNAIIGKDGRIKNLRVISGKPELNDSAVGAVQQWRYRPYFLNGEPIEVQTVITVNFRTHK